MRVFGLLVFAAVLSGHAQQVTLPEAPRPQAIFSQGIPPLALNVAIAERYNFTTSRRETTPSITLDYRLDHVYRVGVSLGHDLDSNSNIVTGFMNVKIGQWGRARP